MFILVVIFFLSTKCLHYNATVDARIPTGDQLLDIFILFLGVVTGPEWLGEERRLET